MYLDGKNHYMNIQKVYKQNSMRKKLNIWLVTVGEPIEEDGNEVRLFPTGLFADWLAKQGHSVTFITNSVDHHQKKQRYSATTTIERSANYKIICLYSRLYNSTISIARFLSHSDAARSFSQWNYVTEHQKPDLILASYPTEEMCRVTAEYAEINKVPLVMYIRDLWPDLFVSAFPVYFQPFVKLVTLVLNIRTKSTLKRANAITGHSAGSLSWGLNKIKRPKTKLDFVFPYTSGVTNNIIMDVRNSKPNDDEKIRICFAGTLSKRSSGLDLVIKSLSMLDAKDIKRIELIICGTGDAEKELKTLAAGLENAVKFEGWVGTTDLQNVYAISDFALLPYTQKDFHAALPNKFSEYLSMDLPIISCTKGAIKAEIEKYNCGIWIEPNLRSWNNLWRKLIYDHDYINRISSPRLVFEEYFSADKIYSDALINIEKIIQEYSNFNDEKLSDDEEVYR